MVCSNILESIGDTPLIRLNRMPEPGSAEVLVKMEALNLLKNLVPARQL